MDFGKIIDFGQAIAHALENPAIQQIASLGGPEAAAIAGMVQKGAAVVDELADHARNEADVLSADSMEKLEGVQARIQAQGDTLDALVNAAP